MKNSVNENNEFKDTLSLHYDNVSDNLNPNKLKTYGSNDINKYLKAPYKYIEDNFINNSDIYNKNILDYCCGTGSYSIMPAQNGANVWGVDISSKSIELAIKRSKILNTSKKCKFEVGDAEKLSFNDNFFENNFGKDLMDIERIRQQMIARQQQFLEKYQSELAKPEEEN